MLDYRLPTEWELQEAEPFERREIRRGVIKKCLMII